MPTDWVVPWWRKSTAGLAVELLAKIRSQGVSYEGGSERNWQQNLGLTNRFRIIRQI
jgi:hypothetical protein